MSVDEQGQLVAETELGPVTFTKPVAYQEIEGKRVDVAVEYEIYAVPQVVHRKDAKNAKESIVFNTESAGNVCPPLAGVVQVVERDPPHVIQPTTNPKSKLVNLSSTEIGDPKLEYGFKLVAYDKTKELVIDPLLASTYLGGSADDNCFSITMDSEGNVYLVGATHSSDFPVFSGSYDNSYDSRRDVFISKISSDLSDILASTYLGGNSDEHGYSVAIDKEDNVYITGRTYSSDFPTSTDAYSTTRNGSSKDVLVTKFNAELTNLIASTYLGGDSTEEGFSIIVGLTNDVYVTGYTNSLDFPTTSSAYDTSYNGNEDAFISRLDSNLYSRGSQNVISEML